MSNLRMAFRFSTLFAVGVVAAVTSGSSVSARSPLGTLPANIMGAWSGTYTKTENGSSHTWPADFDLQQSADHVTGQLVVHDDAKTPSNDSKFSVSGTYQDGDFRFVLSPSECGDLTASAKVVDETMSGSVTFPDVCSSIGGSFVVKRSVPDLALKCIAVNNPCATATDLETVIGGSAGSAAAVAVVELTQPAPAGGATVRLFADAIWTASGIPTPVGIASLPPTVDIPEGESSVTVPIATKEVVFPIVVRLLAQLGGPAKVTNLTVIPPNIPQRGAAADQRVVQILEFFGIHPPTGIGNYAAALDVLRTQRSINAVTSVDIYMAAAEHYLVGIDLAMQVDLSVYRTLVKGVIIPAYELFKYLSLDLRATSRPQSPATLLSVDWGQNGAVDAANLRLGGNVVK